MTNLQKNCIQIVKYSCEYIDSEVNCNQSYVRTMCWDFTALTVTELSKFLENTSTTLKAISL